MTRLPEIQGAAAAAAWGLPHERLLTVSDPVELLLERTVIGEAVERCVLIEEGRANRIGNAVGKALGG